MSPYRVSARVTSSSSWRWRWKPLNRTEKICVASYAVCIIAGVVVIACNRQERAGAKAVIDAIEAVCTAADSEGDCLARVEARRASLARARGEVVAPPRSPECPP